MPRRRNIPAPLTDASRGVRLQKAMAQTGVASRRHCEELIAQGRVHVNGEMVAELPAWVDLEQDTIEVDGLAIAKKRPGQSTRGKHVYIALNKPRRVISTTRDPQGRRTVIDLIDSPGLPKSRLYPVGRLDADSTGLILLTNDGELAHRLTHPSYEAPKQYRVSVRGRLNEDDVAKLKQGLLLAHRQSMGGVGVKRAAMARVKLTGHTRDQRLGDRTQLHITLREGQNREIRRLLARLGFKVRRLERIAIGPLSVKGLGVGQWRMLSTAEVNQLRKLTDLKPPSQKSS